MGRISMRPLLLALAVVLLAAPAAATAKQDRTSEPVKEPTAIGRGGAAATVDVLATAAAVDVLKRGGNAVDAAVAAAGVLGVTEPFSAGIGGGGFMVIRTSKGKVTTIDAREKAHGAMQPNSFWENGVPLPFNDARYSGLSAGVPGTVLGWEKALDRYGTKSLRKMLEYGIDVARKGFVVDQTFFDQTQANVDWFDDVPSSEAIYLDADGTPRDVGTIFRNPDLARAYERIARQGSRGLLPRRHRRGDRGRRPAASHRRGREPRLASGPYDPRRPEALHGARAQAHEGPLPGPRGLRDGAALERRLDGRRGPQHPRGLRPRQHVPHPGAAPLPRGVALRVRRPERVPRRSRVRRRAAPGPALGRVRRGATGADQPRPREHASRGAGGSVAVQRRRLRRRGRGDRDAERDDHPPDGLRPQGHGRLVHVHDRVHRRQRHRRPGLGLPAQQRADGLRLQLPDAPEPGRGRQAAAQLDEPDDRPRPWQAVPRARLARRLDDHHDRPPAAGRPARPRRDPAGGDRRPARDPAQHGDDARGSRVPLLARRAGARLHVQAGARPHR